MSENKLSNEDIERLEEMEQQMKNKGKTETEIVERDTDEIYYDEMLDEYYEKHPEEEPWKHRVKKRLKENRRERFKEKQEYRKAFRKEKYKALEKKAKQQAQKRFGRTTSEKIGNVIFGSKQSSRKHKKTSYKSRPKTKYIIRHGKAFPIHQQSQKNYMPSVKKQYEPKIDPFGSIVTGEIDLSSQLGDIGQSTSKKTKKKPMKIDPFDKLF